MTLHSYYINNVIITINDIVIIIIIIIIAIIIIVISICVYIYIYLLFLSLLLVVVVVVVVVVYTHLPVSPSLLARELLVAAVELSARLRVLLLLSAPA